MDFAPVLYGYYSDTRAILPLPQGPWTNPKDWNMRDEHPQELMI